MNEIDLDLLCEIKNRTEGLEYYTITNGDEFVNWAIHIGGTRSWLRMLQKENNIKFKLTEEALDNAYAFCETFEDHMKQVDKRRFKEKDFKIALDYAPIIEWAFKSDCKKIIFSTLSEEKAILYSNESPFGDEIANVFPSLNKDIINACRCLALEQPLAALFHLMRVMEAAVQILGGILNVEVMRRQNLIPLEDATWQEILTGIENQVNDSYKQLKDHKHTVSPLIEEDPELYRGIYLKLRQVKDHWRNPVMHPSDVPLLEGEVSDVFKLMSLFLKSLIPIVKNSK